MLTELEQRPLLVIAIALALGLVIARNLPLAFLWVVLVILVRPPAIRLTAALAGLVGLWLAPTPPAHGLFENRFLRAEASVDKVASERHGVQTCIISLPSFKLLAKMPIQSRFELGERISFEGVAEPLPEGMDSWALSEQIVGQMRLEPEQVRVISQGPLIYRVADAWRESLFSLADKSLTTDDAGLVEALCFADTDRLDDDRYTYLKTSGTFHIVAASGLHVLILAACVLWLLTRLPIPRGLALGFLAFVLLLYALAAGLHVGTIRAAIMALAGSAAFLFRRESDALSSLSFAAIAILLWQPAAILNVGFHLTFVVVLAIVLFGQRQQSAGLAEESRSTVKTAAVATAAMAPLTALAFGTVSIVAILANIVVVFAVVPIIVLAMLATSLQVIWSEGAANLMRAAGTLSNGLGWMLDSIGPRPWASISTAAFNPYWLIVIYGIPLIFWRKHLRQP